MFWSTYVFFFTREFSYGKEETEDVDAYATDLTKLFRYSGRLLTQNHASELICAQREPIEDAEYYCPHDLNLEVIQGQPSWERINGLATDRENWRRLGAGARL
jgi:hypothetical protein